MDCGDTIIDEGTEIRDEHDVVIKADVIPGADKMVRTLAERGFRIAMVADGLAQSFKNMMNRHEPLELVELAEKLDSKLI